jgi:hypothetical protein
MKSDGEARTMIEANAMVGDPDRPGAKPGGVIRADAIRADAIRMVRADLCRQVDSLERRLRRRGAPGLREEAERIAGIAAEYAMGPAQRIADGLCGALGAGGRGAAVQPWIDRLREAIDCDSQDAGDAWMASVLVRFAD